MAVCTVRADHDLASAVDSVLPQLGSGELLVVWSGARTADAPEVLTPLDPRIRVVAEPRRSSAAARSAALAAAAAPVVLFLDDDCIAAPGWVEAMAAAMAPEDVAAAGGTIEPRWPGGRPRWLHPRLATSYGERAAGDTHHHPFAANMAVRVAAVRAVGGIDPDLGHHGATPGLHEETELVDRLVAAGHRVEDVSGATVTHRVRLDQVRRRWLLRRSWYEGRSDAIVDRRRGRGQPGRRSLKLAVLLVAVVPSQVLPRTGTYVAARLVVNAGYLAERARRHRVV